MCYTCVIKQLGVVCINMWYKSGSLGACGSAENVFDGGVGRVTDGTAWYLICGSIELINSLG